MSQPNNTTPHKPNLKPDKNLNTNLRECALPKFLPQTALHMSVKSLSGDEKISSNV